MDDSSFKNGLVTYLHYNAKGLYAHEIACTICVIIFDLHMDSDMRTFLGSAEVIIRYFYLTERHYARILQETLQNKFVFTDILLQELEADGGALEC